MVGVGWMSEVALASTDSAGNPLASVTADGAQIWSGPIDVRGAIHVIVEVFDNQTTNPSACSAFSFEGRAKRSDGTLSNWATDPNQVGWVANGGSWAANFYNNVPARIFASAARSGVSVVTGPFPLDQLRLVCTRSANASGVAFIPSFRAFVFRGYSYS